ncbi:bifunctional phosphoribosyl-AMP cyclohydrolase/phosphoribosyl-ATP diphosphatase HisIE [Sphingosinicella sp. LHD-64]|uniref:bifunctional phosphoribosyl-AMP cyclohydrolase/phosphoribosyl-ATP diphosphatase HisIE n=1 Tax=Sphingosinicella sp. LHD-64 TaxID=3072139 RepID=UPI00280FA841|nr:bifunctional phosphoribosyl-AMP cyclohydrolase/phosphoribosyl-ATP diphosphatase HisIE [Sphingosinicella sp. LHD-64]MDQ8755579.1 bifunctional phosphoribosyl-AMP cyclohydrolase/phosphoribosyl-ATP diphosphatase HisIE [Sphingosinicella sp. LHD-64]
MRDRNAPLTPADIAGLAWAKGDGLIPAVVQDSATAQVLMLGYMNAEALATTLESGFVTFFSRSKDRLWRKGETSGNTLALVAVRADCDEDALLVLAEPAGSTCHLGTLSCFSETGPNGVGWLGLLARIVEARRGAPAESSYTARLLAEGPDRIAQKVGEEGVEVALAAVSRDRAACISETADLVYHLTVLMEARAFGWEDVAKVLAERHEG